MPFMHVWVLLKMKSVVAVGCLSGELGVEMRVEKRQGQKEASSVIFAPTSNSDLATISRVVFEVRFDVLPEISLQREISSWQKLQIWVILFNVGDSISMAVPYSSTKPQQGSQTQTKQNAKRRCYIKIHRNVSSPWVFSYCRLSMAIADMSLGFERVEIRC